jgi:exoribonuclease-2
MPGMAQVARGAQVKLDILRWDELDLSVEARVLEVLGQTDLGEDDAEDEADADVEEMLTTKRQPVQHVRRCAASRKRTTGCC